LGARCNARRLAADLRAMPLRATLLSLLLPACVSWEPPESAATTTGPAELDTTSTSGWQLPARERGKSSTSTSTSTTTTSSAAPDPDVEPAPTTGAPLPTIDLTALRIAELHPDPAGKDGGPDSPEFLELVHVGEAPLALAGLEIVARSWPVLTAEELGLADATLQPGERLLITRYAASADRPEPAVEAIEGGLRAAFVSEDGLRNADGGVLLRAGDVLGDLLIYGAAQPAPWDSPDWTGPPAPTPGSGASLCRGASDHDDASDWSICAPSPGAAPEPELDATTGTMESSTGEPEPAEVAIVEVLSNPPGPGNAEKAAEFVELVNLGPGSVDLADWSIADTVDLPATGADPLLYLAGDGGCAPSTCLAPGARAIVVGNLYTGPTGPGLVLVTDDTTIANAGLAVHEPVVLRDGSATLRSSYRAWTDPLVAPDPALTEEALLRGDPAAADTPEAWVFAAPSPGQ
jgi:hypothetical protein